MDQCKSGFSFTSCMCLMRKNESYVDFRNIIVNVMEPKEFLYTIYNILKLYNFNAPNCVFVAKRIKQASIRNNKA